MIVGFPGETDEEFEDTLDVVRKVNFEQIFMFIYSRRVGTVADKMENQILIYVRKSDQILYRNIQHRTHSYSRP